MEEIRVIPSGQNGSAIEVEGGTGAPGVHPGHAEHAVVQGHCARPDAILTELENPHDGSATIHDPGAVAATLPHVSKATGVDRVADGSAVLIQRARRAA